MSYRNDGTFFLPSLSVRKEEQEMIQEQIQNQESTWFYIPPNQIDSFKKELYELGCTWRNGDPFALEDSISSFMAVHQDHTIAFISILCWKFSFVCQSPVKHIHYPCGNVIQSLHGEKKEKEKNSI